MSSRRFQPFWILALVPIAFTLHSWIVSGGLPYHTDNNESFSAYVMGQNLIRFDPWRNAFLPDDANASHPGAHPFTYTHGPNGPRYISAVLALAGVSTLSWQILVAAVVATLSSMWFMRQAFREPIEHGAGGVTLTIGTVLAALFCLDMIGTLQYLVNLWRAWHFPLFWGCVWVVRTPARLIWVFVLFFLLFQLEFLFALFTAVSCLGYYVWARAIAKANPIDRRLLTAVAGGTVSVLLFIAQLVAFYGWSGLVFDFSTTYLARNTNSVEWDTIRRFYEDRAIMMWASSPGWNFTFTNFLSVTLTQTVRRIGWGATVLVGCGLMSPLVMGLVHLTRRSDRAAKTSVTDTVAPLLWSTSLAYLVVGVLIPGYTLNGYTYRWAPLLVFPVHLALAVLVAHVASLLATVVKRLPASCSLEPLHRVGPGVIAAIPVLAIWLATAVDSFVRYPTFVHSVAASLTTTYAGRSFVSQTTFPHMVAHYTGRWDYYTPFVFDGTTRLDQSHNWNGDRNINPDYETPEFYLCEQVPYYLELNCDDVARQMEQRGHTIVERGPNYVILRLTWNLPPREAP